MSTEKKPEPVTAFKPGDKVIWTCPCGMAAHPGIYVVTEEDIEYLSGPPICMAIRVTEEQPS